MLGLLLVLENENLVWEENRPTLELSELRHGWIGWRDRLEAKRFPALVKDESLVLGTHIAPHNCLQLDCNLRDSDILFWPSGDPAHTWNTFTEKLHIIFKIWDKHYEEITLSILWVKVLVRKFSTRLIIALENYVHFLLLILTAMTSCWLFDNSCGVNICTMKWVNIMHHTFISGELVCKHTIGNKHKASTGDFIECFPMLDTWTTSVRHQVKSLLRKWRNWG